MRLSSVRVPGKAMLSGEYAVLHGGTAVLAPVPRYLSISESTRNKPEQHSPMIEASLKQRIAETSGYEAESALSNIAVDYGEFLHRDEDGNLRKLGIGSSAAEAVGVIAFRFERAGLSRSDNRDKIAMYAQEVHSDVQGGIGSGADIALCAYGQPLKFRRDKYGCAVETMTDRMIRIPLFLAWTGTAADTRTMVAGFESWLASWGSKASALISDLVESSVAAADAWSMSSTDALFANLDRFSETLRRCTDAAGIPYMLPIHHRLEDWAKARGGRAKPTGAGGGDMILLAGDLPVDELNLMIIPVNT